MGHKYGELHRDGDFHAVLQAYGTQKWYQNDKVHQVGNLFAIVWADGEQWWYQNGLEHRDGDLPALIDGVGHNHRRFNIGFVCIDRPSQQQRESMLAHSQGHINPR